MIVKLEHIFIATCILVVTEILFTVWFLSSGGFE